MRPVYNLIRGFILCGLIVMAPACNSTGEGSLQRIHAGPISVPLLFQPTNELDSHLSLPTGNPKVFLRAVDDDRSDKTCIGHNTEDIPIPVVITGTTADQFVHDALATQLRKISIYLVDSADSADRIISLSLKTLTADEGGLYKAQIFAIVQVTDKGGKLLYDKTVAGESSTWGRSKSPPNYQKVLSNAMIDLSSNLLSATDFSQALSLTPTPGTP